MKRMKDLVWRLCPRTSKQTGKETDANQGPMNVHAPTCGATHRPMALIITPHFPPAELAGGPARTLEAMIGQSSKSVVAQIAVITSAHDLGQSRAMAVPTDRWVHRHDVAVKYTEGKTAAHLHAIASTRTIAPENIYLNSLFHPIFSIFPALLTRLNWWPKARLFIAPRGELDPGALSHKSFKKNLFLKVSRLIRLHGSMTWHASTPLEARNISQHFPRATIVVRENETLLQDTARQLVYPAKHRRIAFLSRISPKKGLHRLLQALVKVDASLSLDIYGEAEDKTYEKLCKQIAAMTPPNIRIQFHGALPHDLVLPTMSTYDLMALPTAGENFGHVIVESLCAGCPVMLPDSTPWTQAAKDTSTLIRGTSIEEWTTALVAYANIDSEEVMRRKSIAQKSYLDWRSKQDQKPTLLDLILDPSGHLHSK